MRRLSSSALAFCFIGLLACDGGKEAPALTGGDPNTNTSEPLICELDLELCEADCTAAPFLDPGRNISTRVVAFDAANDVAVLLVGGELRAMALSASTGSAGTVIASDVGVTTQIAVHGDDAYWLGTSGWVMTAALDGTSTQANEHAMLPAGKIASGLFVTDEYIYVVASSALYRAPNEEGSSFEVVSGLDALGGSLAVLVGDTLFWIKSGGMRAVWASSVSDPGPREIDTNVRDVLESDGTHAYWIGSGSPFTVVRRASPSGVVPYRVQELASLANNGVANGLAVDDYYIYYFNGAGTLFSANKDGSGSEVVISNFTGTGFWLVGADACFVYGVNGAGALVRSPKAPYFEDPDGGTSGGDAAVARETDCTTPTDCDEGEYCVSCGRDSAGGYCIGQTLTCDYDYECHDGDGYCGLNVGGTNAGGYALCLPAGYCPPR